MCMCHTGALDLLDFSYFLFFSWSSEVSACLRKHETHALKGSCAARFEDKPSPSSFFFLAGVESECMFKIHAKHMRLKRQ